MSMRSEVEENPPSARRLTRSLASFAGAAFALVLMGGMLALPAGCRRPSVSDLTGAGRLHDLTQIRRGMSPNEVRRVMGSNYKTIYEEGLQGMDMGIYIWEYREGRVYFDHNGAFKVVPFK
jgi:hypothetical protein